VERLYSTFRSNLSKNFSFGSYTLTVAPMGVKFGVEEGTTSSTPNFTPIGATYRPCGANNLKIGNISNFYDSQGVT